MSIAHRGGTFTLDGPPAQTKLAEQAVRRFYAHAGKPLSLDDIQLGLIELTTRQSASAAAAGDEEGARLRTRRADLHGRTPNQVLYLKHNLNAKLLGSLEGTAATSETDVSTLDDEMQASIREADAFIRDMGKGN